VVAPNVELSALTHPFECVPTAVASRQATDATRREKHTLAGVEQVFGNLQTGLSAADDEHGPVYLMRASIVGDVKLRDLSRQRTRIGRHARHVLEATRNDDGVGRNLPAAREQLPPWSATARAEHLDALGDGKPLCQVLESSDE
jgi:hypothetical protein